LVFKGGRRDTPEVVGAEPVERGGKVPGEMWESISIS